jgi:hypothetical protein
MSSKLSKELIMSIPKKSLKSANTKHTQKAQPSAKKSPRKAPVAAKSLSLKATAFPVDPC